MNLGLDSIRRLIGAKDIPKKEWSSTQPHNLKPRLPTLLFLAFGLILFGLGEALLIASNIGVSPWTVLAQGVGKVSQWSIGFCTFIISLFVLILWFPLKQLPGIGTVLNIIIIAAVIDLSLIWLPSIEHPITGTLVAVLGVLLVGLGSAIYLTANLGAGPRDGLMVGLQKKTGKPIALIRALLEISVVSIGWLLGGTVGLGTIIFALGVGPAVAINLRFVSQRFGRNKPAN